MSDSKISFGDGYTAHGFGNGVVVCRKHQTDGSVPLTSGRFNAELAQGWCQLAIGKPEAASRALAVCQWMADSAPWLASSKAHLAGLAEEIAKRG